VHDVYSRERFSQALRDNEFTLVFQPIVNMSTGTTIGAEALIRWNTPDEPFNSPLDFIPDAESTGAIVEIGNWVVQHALQIAAKWPSDLSVSVNVSGRELQHGGYALMVVEQCARVGFNPSRLQVEVTESFFAVSGSAAQESLVILRESGIEIAVDDFGSGSSDLRRLAILDADIIKIDRSCTAQITSSDGADVHDLEVLFDAAMSAERQIIAEGVETQSQREWLLNKGCELAQGYFYSRPISAEQLVATL